MMLDAGTPIVVVADILGHADPAMTARVYGHVLDGARERAVDAGFSQVQAHRRR